MKSKKGFTIAELTLAMLLVAGIAMILMPSLVADNERQVFSTALQKTYAELQQTNQSVGLLTARGRIVPGQSAIATLQAAIPQTMKAIPANKQLDSLRGYRPNTSPELVNTNGLVAGISLTVLKNGIFIFLDTDGNHLVDADGNPILDRNGEQVVEHTGNLIIDINGKKQPNLVGKDIFYFTVTKDETEGNAYLIEPFDGECAVEWESPERQKGCAKRIIDNNGRIDYY